MCSAAFTHTQEVLMGCDPATAVIESAPKGKAAAAAPATEVAAAAAHYD